jgi:hypothetical protein
MMMWLLMGMAVMVLMEIWVAEAKADRNPHAD